MAAARHSFSEATIAAHRDVLQAFRAMPHLAWTAIAILALMAVLEFGLSYVIPRSSLLGRDVTGVVYYALLTPFFIAVHRFVILGEVTRSYRLEWNDRRSLLFFGWAFGMFVLTRSLALGGVLPKHWTSHLLIVIGLVAVCVVFARLVILLPAIAVDAPGATPRNAFEDTRGHGWYIFFLFLFPFIPSAAVVALVGGLGLVVSPVAGRILLIPLLGLAVLFWLTLGIVVASRLYQNLGNRLNSPV